MTDDLEGLPETKEVLVTLKATDAWETWRVEVPRDATDEWIRENFPTCEKWLKDSGADNYEVTEIEDD